MILDHILDQLNDVETTKNGYRARCPIHDDSGRSFVVITELNDANDLSIECTDGCDFDDLQRALSL